MKKLLSLVLAALMLLSFAACSGSSGNGGQTANATKEPTAEPTEEPMPKVGDTIHGKMFDITITGVSYPDKIENGFYHEDPNGVRVSDITTEEGYSMIRIDYSYSYHGKDTGRERFDFQLDYDNGYNPHSTGHFLPKRETGVVGLKEYYQTGVQYELPPISDALADNSGTGFYYFVVNNTVIENTDKPLILIISMPTALYQDHYGELNDNALKFEVAKINIR